MKLLNFLMYPIHLLNKQIMENELHRQIKKENHLDITLLKDNPFIKSMNKNNVYEYSYSKTSDIPSLYSSLYALMYCDLINKKEVLTNENKEKWINYIKSFQSDDGLLRDPLVSNDIAETEDWWGWRHLTLHGIMGLTILGGRFDERFKVIEDLKEDDRWVNFLESRDWKNKPDFVSNEIQNYGTMLQYSRDFFGDQKSGEMINTLFDFLDEKQDSETGLWGPPFNNKYYLSRGVQTAYHFLLLYFYDNREISYMDQIIDSCLKAQNKLGGFGVQLNSSACEDIDSIDLLSRLYFTTDYKNLEIKKSFEKALKWVLVNQNEDGGFVFKRYESFVYGHENMSSLKNESAMFPTWFRTLSLAYLSKVVDDSDLRKINWKFIDCPGLQFWNL